MIIYTLTNTITQQVYVGITQNCATDRLRQYTAAIPFGIKAPLYDDMRKHGAENFALNECGFAYDMDEAKEMLAETIEDLEAISLQGMKTAASAVQLVSSNKPKPRSSSKSKSTATGSGKKQATPTTKPKLATGRTGSSVKEKKIREAIEKEKTDRLELRNRNIAAEADEMKAIMARLDSRVVGKAKRR